MNGTVSGHLMDAVAAEELERQLRFKRAWEAYYGRTPKPLKVRQGGLDDNVQVNYARLIVNKGVSFLFVVLHQNIFLSRNRGVWP